LTAAKKHSLAGKTVAYVEARMLSEMGALIERNGGTPFAAPVLQEVHLGDTADVIQLIDDLCADKVQVMVFQTGVGTKTFFDSAASRGRETETLKALESITVIARSPKPAAVLRRNKIHIDLMPPEPFTSTDLISAIGGLELAKRHVVVQAYGGPNKLLTQTLEERGATVREVTLYTWELAEDVTPVLGLINALENKQIDALAFTSQIQVTNLLSIASQLGKEGSLRTSLANPDVLLASVGPVCTKRMMEENLRVDIEPEHPHMGNLVLAVAERLNSDYVNTN